ncbi:hypothetical protein LHU53_17380 [Rhodoferax sp. U2-2l]|uniref:hypothetical protein n=1 Tax=Rhodoferax sp. U2-2l TaxID=2884000 RepID=UPI001D0A464C|nr:hypothetical protein [Rhodoferax sp. U2-2l]MCB8748671.1 hypothetical protein [Rhodoferax sp. U2-2l]
MHADLKDFVTQYLSIVGATVMVVGFVAFVVTAPDDNRSSPSTAVPLSAPGQPPSVGS